MMEHSCNPLLFPEYGTESNTNPTFSSNEKGLGEEVYGGELMHWFYKCWTRSHTKKKKTVRIGQQKKQFLLQIFDGCSERVQAQSHWIHAVTVLSSGDEGCYSEWYLLDNQRW